MQKFTTLIDKLNTYSSHSMYSMKTITKTKKYTNMMALKT